jgi:hypothetical protein
MLLLVCGSAWQYVAGVLVYVTTGIVMFGPTQTAASIGDETVPAQIANAEDRSHAVSADRLLTTYAELYLHAALVFVAAHRDRQPGRQVMALLSP